LSGVSSARINRMSGSESRKFTSHNEFCYFSAVRLLQVVIDCFVCTHIHSKGRFWTAVTSHDTSYGAETSRENTTGKTDVNEKYY
jgi:hypothetical protein